MTPAASAVGASERTDPISVGARCDWLSMGFRVRFPERTIEDLKERAKRGKKSGRAAIEFASELWELGAPKPAAYWLENETRGERLEVAPGEPASYLDEGGEVVPGWTLATHASGIWLACQGLAGAVERAWSIALNAGHVYAARFRRVDLATDWADMLPGEARPGEWAMGRGGGNVGRARELENGEVQVFGKGARSDVGNSARSSRTAGATAGADSLGTSTAKARAKRISAVRRQSTQLDLLPGK
jgi:hypothetical protein